MKKRILFRCDGGNLPEIGMGHVTRCLILAEELKKRDEIEISFLMNNHPKGVQKVKDKGFQILKIKNGEDESLKTIEAITGFNSDIVVVDRLSTNADYMALIKRTGVILISLDDLGEGKKFADITINPILTTGEGLYEGFDYMILPGKNNCRKMYSQNCDNIFVSFGGFDYFNITEKILNLLETLDADSNFHIVVSEIYNDFDSLKKRFGRRGNIHFYCNPPEFSDLLNQADVAIVSGGLTLFQAVANGIPALVISQYEHQLTTAQKLEALGAAISLGMANKLDFSLVIKKLKELIHNYELRSKMGIRGRDLIDGLGNYRVCELTGIINKLEWDSNFWNINIAYLYPKKIRENIIKFAFAKCKEKDIDCLFYLCDCHDSTSVQLAEKYGFHFVDVRITFDFNLRANNPTDFLEGQVDDSIAICAAKEADIDSLKEIAKESYIHSRYFFDRHFPADLCRKFYSDWIEKSAKGKFDDIVLVADVEGEVAGYISCKIVTPNLGSISLVGVSQQFRRKHIGVQLVRAALDWFNQKDVPNVRVVTQGRNIPAQHLYQSCGFKLLNTEIWYHKWFTKDYYV